VRDVTLQDALRKLIGPPGEKVTLTVVEILSNVVDENSSASV
jgi:C-terminal processing protease CtpA/Prc